MIALQLSWHGEQQLRTSHLPRGVKVGVGEGEGAEGDGAGVEVAVLQ